MSSQKVIPHSYLLLLLPRSPDLGRDDADDGSPPEGDTHVDGADSDQADRKQEGDGQEDDIVAEINTIVEAMMLMPKTVPRADGLLL